MSYLCSRVWDAKRGVVRFTYLKQDGSERVARGTNYGEIIPPSKMPSGALARKIALGQAEPNYCSIPYFDLDKEEWRAFSVEREATKGGKYAAEGEKEKLGRHTMPG